MSLLGSIGETLKTGKDILLSDSGLSLECVRNLKNGCFLIPEEIIRYEIKKTVEDEKGVTLKNCEFSHNGIHLVVQAKKMGAHLTFPLDIKLLRIAFDGQEQKIEFSFSLEKPGGENLLGKLVACIAGGILRKILKEKIENNKLTVTSQLYMEQRKVVYDLSNLEQLQPLKIKLPILNKQALDFISINDFKHLPSGIELKGTILL